jgi:AcrR family transcriptional regulator
MEIANMGIKERKARESEDLKRQILDAATHILEKEGYRGLSIRKISTCVEYSPAAIYHYFKDKEEIVSRIVAEGYRAILQRLKALRIIPEDPEATFLGMARSYVDLALENRNMFRAVLLEDIGEASEQVWMLEEGILEKRESIAALSRVIGAFVANGTFKPVDLELVSVSIWCALHGLVVRLLLESEVPPARRGKLLNQLIGLLVGGLRK